MPSLMFCTNKVSRYLSDSVEEALLCLTVKLHQDLLLWFREEFVDRVVF